MNASIHTLRSGSALPPRLSCDQLGICHHPKLDCAEGVCHRALLEDGHVDVPLPGALPGLGGGNFWFDKTDDPAKNPTSEDPHGVTPGAQQPHLMQVTPREPTVGEIAWYWTWVFMSYLFCVGLGGWLWAKYGESAVRAFWRVVAGLG